MSRVEPERVDWGWWLIGNLVLESWLLTWRMLRWLVRHPLAVVMAAAMLGALLVQDEYPALLPAVAATGLVAVVVWAWRWPDSFRWRVTWRLRGRLRGWTYRRWWCGALMNVGLDGRDHRTRDRVYPTRSRVVSSRYVDRFTVTMLPGQQIEDYIERADALATTFNVKELRFRPSMGGRFRRARRRVIDVTAIRHDALAAPVEPLAPAADPDLSALPVACTEDGHVYGLGVLGQHVLVGGATGAGKGSALWSIITQLAPGVRSGLVRLHGLDPKAIELPYGRSLFHKVTDGTHEELATTLEHLVEVMNQRKQVMSGVSRLHEPTTDEPLIVVIIDELAALTSYTTESRTKKRIEAALGLLLSQGRAMAISVVAAAQDPRKEVLGQRGLFTTRIGMRLNEKGDVDMLLGDGARARGAACHRISHATPGVAYVMRDGEAVATRIRFPWISDDLIREYAATYGVHGEPVAPVVELHDGQAENDDEDAEITGAAA